MDEVDVESVDLGLELRKRIQPRLAPAPVVLRRPVVGELLNRAELHSLGPIGNELSRGPARRVYPTAKLVEVLLGHIDAERTDLGPRARNGSVAHDALPLAFVR